MNNKWKKNKTKKQRITANYDSQTEYNNVDDGNEESWNERTNETS